MDARTEELRAAHDVLSEFYAEYLDGALDRMPGDRALLGLFCELTLGAGIGAEVADVGCGTGRLEPFLAGRGLAPRGFDLSPEMIRVARREQPGFEYEVADLRALPPAEMERLANDAGFATVFWAGIPPEKEGASTQGFLIARKA